VPFEQLDALLRQLPFAQFCTLTGHLDTFWLAAEFCVFALLTAFVAVLEELLQFAAAAPRVQFFCAAAGNALFAAATFDVQVEFVFLFAAAHADVLTVFATDGVVAADTPAVPATRIHAKIAIIFLFISLLLFSSVYLRLERLQRCNFSVT
jgi:hypothetical protein